MSWEERRMRELAARIGDREMWIERLERELAEANESIRVLQEMVGRAYGDAE